MYNFVTSEGRSNVNFQDEKTNRMSLDRHIESCSDPKQLLAKRYIKDENDPESISVHSTISANPSFLHKKKMMKYDSDKDYAKEIQKMYSVFNYLYGSLKKSTYSNDLIKQNAKEFEGSLKNMERSPEDSFDKLDLKKKEQKRQLNLNTFYKCYYDKCSNIYSNEMQQNVHIIAQHDGGTKEDRLDFIREVWKALKRNTNIPSTNIIMPDSITDKIRKIFIQLSDYEKEKLEFSAEKYYTSLIVYEDDYDHSNSGRLYYD